MLVVEQKHWAGSFVITKEHHFVQIGTMELSTITMVSPTGSLERRTFSLPCTTSGLALQVMMNLTSE